MNIDIPIYIFHVLIPRRLGPVAERCRDVRTSGRFRYRSPIWCYRYESRPSPTHMTASDSITAGSGERSTSLLTYLMSPTVFQPLYDSSIGFLFSSCPSPFPVDSPVHDHITKFHYLLLLLCHCRDYAPVERMIRIRFKR